MRKNPARLRDVIYVRVCSKDLWFSCRTVQRLKDIQHEQAQIVVHYLTNMSMNRNQNNASWFQSFSNHNLIFGS